MLEKEWVRSEGVTDSQNSFDAVCVKAADSGISIAYSVNGDVYIVDIKGVFDVSPMAATGYTQEQVQEFLQPGSIAVPVIVQNQAHVLTISYDYNLTIVDEMDVIAKGIVDVDNVEECVETDDLDETLKSLLGFM